LKKGKTLKISRNSKKIREILLKNKKLSKMGKIVKNEKNSQKIEFLKEKYTCVRK